MVILVLCINPGIELKFLSYFFQFSSVQSLNHVQLFVAPWTVACHASLSITNLQSLLKLMSIELVMPSNHLIPCCLFSCLQSFPGSGYFLKRVSSSHQVAKELEFQLQHQSFKWIFRTEMLYDWVVWSLCSPRDSWVFSNNTVQKHQLFDAQLSLWSNFHIHTWLLEKNHSFA